MPHFKGLALFTTAAILAAAATGAAAQTAQPTQANWVATWGTSVQAADPQDNQKPLDADDLTDTTIRQVVHLSVGGSALRVVFSNTFGTQPLVIDAASVALPVGTSAAILPGSDHPLLFSGRPSVTIPVGANYISDPVTLAPLPLSNLTITFHLPAAPVGQSAHPGSRETSFLLHGNHVSDADLPGAEKIVRWFQIAEVDVTGGARGAVVALGDSITDGHAAITDGNTRWPDYLAAHLHAGGVTDIGVVNEGIGGNHLLTNGLGDNVLERFDRDVLSPAAGRYILVLEGINDLGGLGRRPDVTPAQHTDLVQRIEAAFMQIIERGHAHGMRVYGATITPDGGSGYYHPSADDEAARQAINAWIRQPGHFDGFVDFDQVVRDPAHPDQLLPAYDSGDHLHPGPAGYKAMGEAVPLAWFR